MLIYAIDNVDPIKHLQAVELLNQLLQENDPPVLLWQVACEYLGYLHRQQNFARFSEDKVAEEFQKIIDGLLLLLPEPEIFAGAMQLFCRHSLSHWDSLLIAACISAGVDTLYSEDMSHGATYDSVTVLNPFKS